MRNIIAGVDLPSGLPIHCNPWYKRTKKCLICFICSSWWGSKSDSNSATQPWIWVRDFCCTAVGCTKQGYRRQDHSLWHSVETTWWRCLLWRECGWVQ